MSASSARLKYKIVKCTSEDQDYPVSELLTHSSQTKGWQTARFCDFPQEMGLEFETPVHLKQVQFLSHQSKIATKIELFTALPSDGLNGRYETSQFKRLGYLSLDSNERSQFQARELKSVYVDVSAQFLRILFHKCHVNRFNIVNQVGLIALNCLGEALGPDLAVGPPRNPTLARGPEPQQQIPAVRNALGVGASAPIGPGITPAAPAPPQSSAAVPASAQQSEDAAQDAADEMRFDVSTLQRIRSLTLAKQRAVEAEDYEEAKRCKEMLVRLRQTGLLLRELEDRKRAAVSNEDYDAAKALKVEIDRLRVSIEKPHAALGSGNAVPGGSPTSEQAVAEARPDNGMFGQAPVYAGAAGGCSAAAHYQQGFSRAQHPQSSCAEGAAPEPASSNRNSQEDLLVAPQPRGYNEGARQSAPVAPAPFDSRPPGRESAVSPLLPAHKSAGGAQAPWGSCAGSRDTGPPERATASVATPIQQDLSGHPLSGVPNIEDLGQPDPLMANFEQEAEPLIPLFGDYVTRCIYSKSWSLRDAAVQKLTLDLRDGRYGDRDPKRLLQALSTILMRMIPDKNVQVFLSGAILLQTVCRRLLDRGPLKRPDAQAALDPLMPLIVDRLGDPNSRVENATRDAHLDFARCPTVGAAFTAQYLLKPINKKTVPPRVYTSRLQLLTTLVLEVGIQPDSRDGLPLEPTMKLAMGWFSNANADVRENVVRLVAACYTHVGLARIEKYLANLRNTQREVFDAEFEKNSQGAAGNVTRVPNSGAARVGGRSVGRQDYEDDGLPAPEVPPAHVGASRLAAEATEPYDEDDILDEYTCQFCGRQDPTFTPEALDVHYWRECPMLTQCELCQQVIEISTLRGHLVDECEHVEQARDLAREMMPGCCPLCRANIGGDDNHEFRAHLLSGTCRANPRRTR